MPPPPGSSPAHKFEKVAEGVYFGSATGSIASPANSPVIVNDEDVLVIDPGITAADARALVADVKTVTNKPVKFAVDSHYHYDHAHGNQVFGPDVTLIGSDMTYARLSGQFGDVRKQMTYTNSVLSIPGRIDNLKRQVAQEMDPQKKAILERQLESQQLHWQQEQELRITPPTTTFKSEMVLHRGTREIQLLYLGRGHTDSDIVVYLPKERVICTGDLMEGVISYGGDAYFMDWPDTLDKLMKLDFDTVLPGHGQVFHGKQHIVVFQKYLRDLTTQALALKKQGVMAEDAAKRIDVGAYADEFPALRERGVAVAAVQRLYDLAENPSAPVR
jgi:glyoxylase-like metal-dependent hydrolase (beta-lactamase superfamily II)